MNITNDLRYIEMKNLAEKLKDSTNPLHSIYRHETNNLFHQVEGIELLIRQNELEKKELEEVILGINSYFENALELVPLLKIEEFSRNGLTTLEITDFYNTIKKQIESYESLYNSKFKIEGMGSILSYVNPAAMTAFLSTNIGDAVKWSPKDKEIKIKLGKGNMLTIENKFGENPTREDIGMGQKIGSEYTKLFTKKMGIKYLSVSANGTFKKTFYFPKEETLIL